MSESSFWYVGHAPDALVSSLQPTFSAFADNVENDPSVVRAMAAWRAAPASIHGPRPGEPTSPTAQEFIEAFRLATPESDLFYACALDDHEDSTWDLSEPYELDEPPRALFAATPGLPTASLLYIGLGPERAKWLPGHMGNFALTHDELESAAHSIRRAHALPPQERAEAVNRMYAWLSAGTADGFPVVHMLSALPDLIGSGLARGLGIVGATLTA